MRGFRGIFVILRRNFKKSLLCDFNRLSKI